ncbi:MAG: hypothetical protein LBO66_15405 [Deltaproteobacteria bacterium]|jgi:hypothetical protein|nr:hypothetical protein [Deltaproteobacteria bacterium]
MPDESKKSGFLGTFLDAQLTKERVRTWRIVFFVALLATVLLAFLIPNHHPHFGLDKYPAFWAAFGLVVGVALVLFVKKIVQPLIKRSEDHYGDL